MEKDCVRLFGSGKIIHDRYIIKRKIGDGGMSNIYLAYDTVQNSNVALKCSRSFRIPLAKEYHMMKSLNCTGVPGVFDLFEYEGALVMPLEYIDGGTLGEVVENVRTAEKADGYIEPLRVMIDVCMTADYLHREKGILYLDYKPSNIIAGSKGTYLIDFGAAADLKDVNNRGSIGIYGTKKYAAPEQKTAGRALTVRTDIYQIGALTQYIIKKCNVRDRTVRGIAKRCMERKMPARYASAKEVAALLAGCIKYDAQIFVKTCKPVL
ncbi:MAG: protein kinase [Lachnospiraceae bacterium]|nr:protein kinase [Lachnospiraceae bacterium]